MRIKVQQNVYLYGTYYETCRTRVIREEDKPQCDIIIYLNPLGETARTISSLEGLFVSKMPLPFEEDGNPICMREQMRAFAKRHLGKFFPFEE